MKKEYIAEFFGTAVLVTFGCGTAMTVGTMFQLGCGYLATALAFGVGLMMAIYMFGDVSGGHFNPAVSLAMYKMGKLKGKDLGWYIVAQCIGAWVAIALLATFVMGFGSMEDATRNFASNSTAGVFGSWATALVIEIALTMVFVMIILKVTDKNSVTKGFNGIIIGLSLTCVHLLGIPLTGTSVNPARSLGSAYEALLCGNFVPMSELWIFIIGPMFGALLAVELYCYFYRPRKNVRKSVQKKEESSKEQSSENPKEKINEETEEDSKENAVKIFEIPQVESESKEGKPEEA
jgi:aquaporin Z